MLQDQEDLPPPPATRDLNSSEVTLQFPSLPAHRTLSGLASHSIEMRKDLEPHSTEHYGSLEDSSYEVLGASVIDTSDDEDHDATSVSLASYDGNTPDDVSSIADTEEEQDEGDPFFARESVAAGEDSHGMTDSESEDVLNSELTATPGSRQLPSRYNVEQPVSLPNTWHASYPVNYQNWIRLSHEFVDPPKLCQVSVEHGCAIPSKTFSAKPFRVLYVGPEGQAYEQVKCKVAAALNSAATRSPGSEKGERLNVVPVTGFGGIEESPEVELVPAFPVDITIDSCFPRESTFVYNGKEKPRSEIISTVLQAPRPDIAIIIYSDRELCGSYKSQFNALSHALRWLSPLEMVERCTSTKLSEGGWAWDANLLHLRISGVEKESKTQTNSIRTLLDLEVFSSLEPRVLGSHFAYTTGRYQWRGPQWLRTASARWTDAMRWLISATRKHWKSASVPFNIPVVRHLGLMEMLTLLLSVGLLFTMSGVLYPEPTSVTSISSVQSVSQIITASTIPPITKVTLPNSAMASHSTSSSTLASTAKKTTRVQQQNRPVSGWFSSGVGKEQKPNSLGAVQAPLLPGKAFKLERGSPSSFVLTTLKSRDPSILRKLDINVTRDGEPLVVKKLTVITSGLEVILDESEAFGVLQFSIVERLKNRIIESHDIRLDSRAAAKLRANKEVLRKQLERAKQGAVVALRTTFSKATTSYSLVRDVEERAIAHTANVTKSVSIRLSDNYLKFCKTLLQGEYAIRDTAGKRLTALQKVVQEKAMTLAVLKPRLHHAQKNAKHIADRVQSKKVQSPLPVETKAEQPAQRTDIQVRKTWGRYYHGLQDAFAAAVKQMETPGTVAYVKPAQVQTPAPQGKKACRSKLKERYCERKASKGKTGRGCGCLNQ